MRRFPLYCWICWTLLIGACVSTPVHTPEQVSRPPGPGEPLFQQGEQLLERNAMDEALASYSRYLSQFPDGQRADAALGRIGLIYSRQGQLEASHAFYQRLVDQFPQSPLVNDARLAIIDLLFQKQQPAEAIVQAQQMLAADPDEATRRKLWQQLARQYENSGDIANAVAYAYMLYQSAPGTEKESWAEQLRSGISRLDIEAIELLWDQIDDEMARSHLMYRYATVLVVGEQYDDALEVLIAFQEAYPDHLHAQDAAQIIGTLEERLRFSPLTVGCLLPLSGSYQIYGQRALNGIELALSLMQSEASSPAFRLVIKDSGSVETRAVQGVRALADAKAGVIIGPIVTAPSAAAEAQKLHIPMVTFTQKPDITEIGDFIFRHFITPQHQVNELVTYFTKGVGLRDFAILYPKEAYGQTFMTLFWQEVIRQGGRVVGVESYDTGQTDFAGVIRKLTGTHHDVPKDLRLESAVQIEENPYFRKASTISSNLEDVVPDPVTRLTGLFFQEPDQDRVKGPRRGRQQKQQVPTPHIDFDVLFIPDGPKTAGLILPQLVYHDVRDIYLAGTNLWHSEQLITMSRDYAQSAVMAEGFFKQSPEPPVQKFVQAYQELYGKEPGIIEAFAFDTARLLFRILSESDIHHRHDLRDALLEHFEFEGVTGPTAFAGNGEPIKRLRLLKVKGSQFAEIPYQ
jgi:ABC-type branched-subunit amino acid transport system substrate-binding protein/outer membrane protein assembly factor BamD (BamD/ComL family)